MAVLEQETDKAFHNTRGHNLRFPLLKNAICVWL